MTVAFNNAESTMFLKKDDNGVLYAVKFDEDEASFDDYENDAVKLKVAAAGTYVMTAADLNTKKTKDGVQYMELDFGDANSNNIFAQKLQAQQLNRTSDGKAGSGFTYTIDNTAGYSNGA